MINCLHDLLDQSGKYHQVRHSHPKGIYDSADTKEIDAMIREKLSYLLAYHFMEYAKFEKVIDSDDTYPKETTICGLYMLSRHDMRDILTKAFNLGIIAGRQNES